MRFPTINEVVRQLREINKEVDSYCDVRLQVYENGDWAIRFGSSDYDQDHSGYWGCSEVPGRNRRFRSKEVAKDLIYQAEDDFACSRENKSARGNCK